MFRKQKAGFKWGLLEQIITQKTLTEISPKEGATLSLSLAENHINGVMSWFLISQLLSRDGGVEKIQDGDP